MVMRKLREATKPIMLLAAAAFVALMVFEWGMDITGQSSGGLGEIGRVNGEPVSYDAYMAAYRNLYDQVQRTQEAPITSQQNKELEDAAWDEVVNQILIRQELRRRGIGVTDEEIRQAAQLSPPADLRPQFTNEQGQFDLAAYQQFLASLPQDQLLLLEAYYRDVIPRGKLLRQVSTGMYPTDAELWRMYRDQHDQVWIRYIALDPATRYPDDEFEVTDEEIEAYYEANKEEFAIPARATVKVVVLDKTPTPEDTAAMRTRAMEIRQRLVEGEDFAELARTESADDATAQQGGELGVFRKGQMVAEFDSAVFRSRPGEIVGPVRTAFGYHVIEVEQRWGQDSAQARHILIPFQRTDDSEIELLTMADSLEDLSEQLTLEDAASTVGLSATTVQLSENFPFIQGAGQITEGVDWVFEEAEPGDVSPVFETDQAFYVLELVDKQPAGYLPLEDARPAIEATLRFQKKMEQAVEEGEQILARIRQGESLESIADELGLQIREAGPFTRNDFVPGIGRHNAAIGAAFGLRPGEISDVVTTTDNAFILEQIAFEKADSAAWLSQKLEQRQQVIAALQQQRLQEWIEALRASARIVDRRAEVLQPADESDVPQLPRVF